MIQFRNLRISKFPRSQVKAWKATIWCKIGPSSIAYHETAYTKLNLQKRILVLFSERNNGIFLPPFPTKLQKSFYEIPSVLCCWISWHCQWHLFSHSPKSMKIGLFFPNISAMNQVPSTWYNGQALNASSLSSRSIALSITPWDFSQLAGNLPTMDILFPDFHGDLLIQVSNLEVKLFLYPTEKQGVEIQAFF